MLLERQSFPRDKSCGDGLTRPAVRLLAEMRVLPHLGEVQHVRGVRVFMRGKGSRDFEYPDSSGGIVVPRLHLDQAICQQAVAAGAELWQRALVTRLIREAGAVAGVEVRSEGAIRHLRAPVVVLADGAASRLSRQVGPSAPPTAADGMGTAIRGYYTDIATPGDLLEIYTPLLDPTDRYLLPSYGWVFPIDATTANIGVGLFHRERGANVRDLFERFLGSLRDSNPRFAMMRQRGAWQGAPLRFDFAPERCHAPGLLLVGDAAGMISPFTGEGISYALESGKVAAEVIDQTLISGASETPDLSPYARRLERTHTGYFEAGRQSARRYLLVWHVLESTFHNERPLFSLCRQAVVFPEGMGESYADAILDDVGPLVGQHARSLRADLFAVGDILIDTVRHDWPFLARLSLSGQDDPGVPFRPALLLTLAASLSSPKKPQTLMAGAAVELGYLAALAQLSVLAESDNAAPSDGSRSGNWGNMFAVMVGDFLLSKAYELSAQVGAGASQMIAESLATACEGRVRELRNAHNLGLTPAEHIDILTRKAATLFALPCMLGARLSGASAAHTTALATYGRHLGLAYQLTDDVRSLQGTAGWMGTATRDDLGKGVYSLSVLLALRKPGPQAAQLADIIARGQINGEERQIIAAIVAESGARGEALTLASHHAEAARMALARLPDGPTMQILGHLATFAVTRQTQIS